MRGGRGQDNRWRLERAAAGDFPGDVVTAVVVTERWRECWAGPRFVFATINIVASAGPRQEGRARLHDADLGRSRPCSGSRADGRNIVLRRPRREVAAMDGCRHELGKQFRSAGERGDAQRGERGGVALIV